MNRFKTRRKPKAQTADDESSGPFRMFGKGKKTQEDVKKEFNLAAALPSNDDFRTSLLMNGLSARFSMLREQDDPNTKIGKASDDSVLYPKRQSRMMIDYRFAGGLGDIAEVESIRAPFARTDSFHSEDSQGGSVMDRPKPNEGNNLFGGRQKVYKIPVGAASSGRLGAGMGGKVVYEDDIALSAFQKWKQAERERGRRSWEFEDHHDLPRPESPTATYNNRNWETNSTASSGPSVGRNSTAATSFTSQPPSSIKDWQSAAPTSASPTPAVDRNMIRTRRLYEQGLTQELQDQQSSALSRIDTLSRQRNFGTRTPDLFNSSNTSPALSLGPFEAPAERRLLTAKASAPNLRSISPPTSGSSTGTMDLGIKMPSLPDPKPAFGSAPPLSPPVSETEDYHPVLPIQPGDRGKATALGMFQKPAATYDESKYAERQIQLQQGRETPTNRFRAESNASLVTARSRSNSSANRMPFGKPEPLSLSYPTLKEEPSPQKPTFLDTSNSEPVVQIPAPRNLQRPSDSEHPAFRDSAFATPLSFKSKLSSEASPIVERPVLLPSSGHFSPEDSPTLPTPGLSAGLSGMVRQHLRSDSNASSVYGAPPQHQSTVLTRLVLGPEDTKELEDLGSKSNPWATQETDWSIAYYAGDKTPERKPVTDHVHEPIPELSDPDRSTGSSSEMEKEHDEFATQLASAQRRIRERMTSYVESDNSRGTSPMREPEPSKEQREPKGATMNLLKPKSSRGSLIDRSREAASHSKAMKMLGIGATMSTSPSPNKPNFEEREAPLESMAEEPLKAVDSSPALASSDSEPAPCLSDDDQENMPAGLKAFRQARRELQRLKEREVQERHQHPVATRTTPSRERGQNHRTPSREQKPPPVFYQQRAPSQESRPSAGGSRAASRPPSERNRSGSETSNTSQSGNRPPRIRNGPPYDDYNGGMNGPMNSGRPLQHNFSRSPAVSPGLPGTDIKRSPYMPPQQQQQVNSPGFFGRSEPSHNLNVNSAARGFDSGQASPISPMGALPSPYLANSGNATPTGHLPSPRRPPNNAPIGNLETGAGIRGLDESMKRVVRKKDISEPTFVSTTSRVPVVNLPEQPRSRSASRSRAGSLLSAVASSSTPNLHSSGGHAPPLPPLNPKRRNFVGTLMGRRDDDASLSSPHLPMVPVIRNDAADENRSAFSVSDDEEGSSRKRLLRKMTTESAAPSPTTSRMTRRSPPYGAKSPQIDGGMI